MTPINTKESGGAIKAEFKPQAGDVVITRQRASAFYGTALMAQLTQLGVRTVIVCGESTSGCVRASSAYSNGFHVVLVEECWTRGAFATDQCGRVLR
jgi:maleamate amidohydrolase